MARTSPPAQDRSFSPPRKNTLHRRLEEAGGLLLCGLACVLLVALASYNPADPSFDTATGQPPTNLLGLSGSFVADGLLQGLGLGALLPAFMLLIWGWRLMAHHVRGLEPWPLLGLRAAAVLGLLPVVAALLAAIPLLFTALPTPHWPSEAGLGGGIGHSIAQAAVSAGMAAIGPAGGMVVWLMGGLLACMLLALGTGLRREEWLILWRAGSFLARMPLRLARLAARSANGAMARQNPPAPQAPITRPDPYAQPAYTQAPRTAPTGNAFAATRAPAYNEELDDPDDPYAIPRAQRSAHSTPATPPESGTALVLHHSAQAPEAAPIAPSHTDLTPYRPVTNTGHNEAEDGFSPALARSNADAPSPLAPQQAAPTQAEPSRNGLLGRLFAAGRRDATDTPTAGGQTGRAGAERRRTGWELPPISLLRPAPAHARLGPSPDALNATALMLEQTLADYGVQGKITGMSAGPVVTLYEFEPAPGIRSARVIGLADDVARSLSVLSVRIATVPGRNVMGIEVPNQTRETVYLSELLDQPSWRQEAGQLPLALGKDIAGETVLSDLARMPHLLVAGTTGSGKSVGVNAMILSLLFRFSPEECRLIMIDPKVLELSIYDGIPHLLTPVVTDPPDAVKALKWVVREMDRRYRTMAHLQVRNIAGYNARAAEALADGEVVVRRVQTGFDPETGTPVFEEQSVSLNPMPYIVVIIDEMADLMMTAGKEIDACVQRLAQKARAAGIHVIMATQRPSVDVITGTIKANFPTRISFQVISKFDSRTILGEQGAEQLLGQGDMLFMQGGGRITRVHGPFVADHEVEQVVGFLKEQGEPVYDEDVLSEPADEAPSGGSSSRGNSENGEADLYTEAVSIVTQEGKASTSFIQRHLSIGYNRAAKLIEQMEKEGVISRADHVGRRKVLVGPNRED
ncbi:MAG: DNA translocase FtsK [Acetobacter papayae]|uniref:DNA translocase FtsK n=1 Tax=Acetobacter papayae TaxID=1076592 RepID=UPI0039ED553C